MHAIELLEKEEVARLAKEALENNSKIVEFGASRDYGSSSILASLAIESSSRLVLVDPSESSLENAKNSVHPDVEVEYHQTIGEDLSTEQFEGAGVFHLDGFDIVTRHPHKQSTIDSYLKSGIDLLRDGNVLSAKSHLEIARKIMMSARDGKPRLALYDDTWLEDGVWMGKGASAVPYMLANGWVLVSRAFRSKLPFRRYKWGVALYLLP